MNWTPDSKTTTALMAFLISMLSTILTVVIYAALTSVPDGLEFVVYPIGIILLLLIGRLYTKGMPDTPRRRVMALPVLLVMALNGAVLGSSLSLTAILLSALILMPTRLSYALPHLIPPIILTIGLTMQIHQDTNVTSILICTIPFLMLSKRHANPEIKNMLQDEKLLGLILALNTIAAINRPQPVYLVIFTVITSVILLLPSEVFQKIRDVRLGKRHVSPSGIHGHVTEKK